MSTSAPARCGRYRTVRGRCLDPNLDQAADACARATSRSSRKQRLLERADVIARTVLAQQPFYASQACTANQRQLLETMIGAAIWYLPQGPDLWTGRLSENSLRALAEARDPRTVRLTKEHQFPCKLAAAQLMAIDWELVEDPADEVLRRYQEHYGRFNYVLPEENKRLMRFQKSGRFLSPEQAYLDAGIHLKSVSETLLKAILAGDRELASLVLSGDTV